MRGKQRTCGSCGTIFMVDRLSNGNLSQSKHCIDCRKPTAEGSGSKLLLKTKVGHVCGELVVEGHAVSHQGVACLLLCSCGRRVRLTETQVVNRERLNCGCVKKGSKLYAIKSFESNFDKTDGCWLWQGAVDIDGYGIFSGASGFSKRAHRAAYHLYVKDPGGFHVCHSCDVPSCVNPSHMFLGTQEDNMADMVAKGRSVTCGNGHHSRKKARK